MARRFDRKIILEDGSEYPGFGFGSPEDRVCEIVFNTSMKKFDSIETVALLDYIKIGTDDRVYALAELLRRNVAGEELSERTGIDMLFMNKFRHIVELEKEGAEHPFDLEELKWLKKYGFCDRAIADLWKSTETQVSGFRRENGVFPVYKMIDTCASEFDSYIPYFYSTYADENESVVTGKKKIIVLGSGPIRIGQGIEFDYSTVHAVMTIKRSGCEAIIINNNPETVSTDYTCSDKLYFEPLTVEDVMMEAALAGVTRPDGGRPLLLAVTQLTSTGEDAMKRELLIDRALPDVVLAYAQNAKAAGLDGVVCSPLEAPVIHAGCGAGFLTVTPGVRFADGERGDQARVATPAAAKELGSDYIVVGRPITKAADPVFVWRRCIREFTD